MRRWRQRLAFALGGSALSLRVAGGTIDFGTSTPGIALWVELLQPDGGASPDPWTLAVLGPGIPATEPITFDYPPANGRAMFWEYDVPAMAGSYSLTATDADAGTALSTSFSIGPPVPLPVPSDVSTQAGANGGVTVQWSPVAGAAGYDVTAWTTVNGSSTFYVGQWVGAPPASFPKDTFVSGTAYDVYVAATSVDMLDGGVPAQLSVSENSYQPASFTAP